MGEVFQGPSGSILDVVRFVFFGSKTDVEGLILSLSDFFSKGNGFGYNFFRVGFGEELQDDSGGRVIPPSAGNSEF